MPREAGKSSQRIVRNEPRLVCLKCSKRCYGEQGIPLRVLGPLGSCALCVYTDVVFLLHKYSCIQSQYKLAHNRFE